MPGKVRLIDSGHEFVVESPEESLLDGGLKAGLGLNYGCGNGTCGLCRARLAAGSVRRLFVPDRSFDPAEKAAGWLLMCAHTPEGDVALSVAVSDSEIIPDQFVSARVAKRELLTEEILRLTLRTPRSQRFRFRAGQYASLAIPGGPPSAHLIASCPCEEMRIEFHLRRDAGRPFVVHAFEGMVPNEEVTIQGPEGGTSLTGDAPRPFIFVAWDEGFAGIKSLIEQAVNREIAASIQLFRVAANPARLYLDNLCRSWRDSLDGFACSPLLNSREDLARELNGALQRTPEAEIYLCGPREELEWARSFFGRPVAALAIP